MSKSKYFNGEKYGLSKLEIEKKIKKKKKKKERVTNCLTTDLTLKAPITASADDIRKYLSLFFRENKA